MLYPHLVLRTFIKALSYFPRDQDSETLVRERARGSKLENDYEIKKGNIIAEPQKTITLKERSKSQAKLYSKRNVALTKEIANDQSNRQNYQQPMRAIQPKKATKPKQSPSKKAKKIAKGIFKEFFQRKFPKKFPKELERLQNWRELLLQDTDEEEEEMRKQLNKNNSAIQATAHWENPKKNPKVTQNKEHQTAQANAQKDTEMLLNTTGTR